MQIAGGEYVLRQPLVFDPQDSGSEAFPITYRARSGQRPIFSGGLRITRFEETSAGIWSARLPAAETDAQRGAQLFVNGGRAIRARTPNRGCFQMLTVKETVLAPGERVPEKATQTVQARRDDLATLVALDQDELDDVELIVYHKWDCTRRFIDSVMPAADDPESTLLVTSGQGMKPWNPWKKDTRYYIENLRPALDQPGEWFLDRGGQLSYIPRADERPEDDRGGHAPGRALHSHTWRAGVREARRTPSLRRSDLSSCGLSHATGRI